MGKYAYRVDSKTGEERSMTFKLSALDAWEAILPYLCNEVKEYYCFQSSIDSLPLILYVEGIRQDMADKTEHTTRYAEILQMIIDKVPLEEHFSVFRIG